MESFTSLRTTPQQMKMMTVMMTTMKKWSLFFQKINTEWVPWRRWFQLWRYWSRSLEGKGRLYNALKYIHTWVCFLSLPTPTPYNKWDVVPSSAAKLDLFRVKFASETTLNFSDDNMESYPIISSDELQSAKLRKMFFHLVTSVGQRNNSESPWGIEPQTFGFALRCSTTEPQRLFGERGLLRSSNDTRPAYC